MSRSSLSHRPGSSQARSTVCPLLGTVNESGEPAAHIEYPSFENRCLATSEGTQIILTEQATFCLSAAHRTCPRFLAAAAARPDRIARPQASYPRESTTDDHAGSDMIGADMLSTDMLSADMPGSHMAESGAPFSAQRIAMRRRQWGWIGAAMIFVSTLLCGSVFAVYVGWQIANSSYMAVEPGSLNTLSSVPEPQPQVYLIVTATSPPSDGTGTEGLGAEAAGAQVAANSQPQNLDPSQLPQAVTPTPMPLNSDAALPDAVVPQTELQNTELQNNGQGEPLPDTNNPADNSQQTQLPNSPQPGDTTLSELQLEIPTRRPTPLLDIPTSTPLPPEMLEVPTPTPTPTLGEPMVLFSAEETVLMTGECTIISWSVENVRAVYFDSTGVNGHDQREVCMRDKTSEYLLTVITGDGNPRYYTTTLEYLAPTPTPTPTFTFTPEPILTPTWTPIPPTNTPAPNIQYGASLASQGGTDITCAPDARCEINLLITNSGSAGDNITAEITGAGAWPAQLCRIDGVCGSASLTIMSMGPGNTALINLVIDVPPADSQIQEAYTLRALSEGSGKTVGSNSLQLSVVSGQ